MKKYLYDAVIFDLLTGLIDSWSLWNEIAGSEKLGFEWRARYLEITYSTFEYKKYEDLVLLAAKDVGLNYNLAKKLFVEWGRLNPWPETNDILKLISKKYLIGVATNCSIEKGEEAINIVDVNFDYKVTAEEVGFYKPHPATYNVILKKMKALPKRTLFVAGSAHDVQGAKTIGMDVFWHNRIGLKNINENMADYTENSLHRLADILNL